MAQLSRSRGSRRASVSTSGSSSATTYWQKECESGVWRARWYDGGRPSAPGKTWRSSSTIDTRATGTPSECRTSRA